MPNRSIRARWALALAVVFAVSIPSAAQAADDVVAELRVATPAGDLETGNHYVTNTEQIKTDPDALCFEDAEGGSGDRVRLAGPTAMGLVETAGDATPAVNPLSVTDEFGFGLGLCSIGNATAGSNEFWSLAVNHQASQVGGDQVELSDGDSILWSLTDFTVFPPVSELQLTAAPGTDPGSLNVGVLRWVCSTAFPPPDPVCTSEPAADITVSGGDANATTDENGSAIVTMANSQTYELQATNEGDLDSNIQEVCVSATAGECPSGDAPRGWRITGRALADDFSATEGWDVVKAKGGDDRIDLGHGSDRVNCGGGKDRVKVVNDGDDEIAGNCEKVKTVET